MTREEAIGHIKDVICENNTIKPNIAVFELEKEALYMAIEALEQELCEDCISRQAVIDTLDTADKFLDEDRTVERYKAILTEAYEVLPSVNPKEPKTGQWVKTPKAVMGDGYMWYCNKCEHQVYQDSSRPYPSEKYCPNCGARMEGGAE